MFVDHALIHCFAGTGGKGCNAFYRSNTLRHPRPQGGDGGNGGSIYLIAADNIHTLLDVQMRRTFKAKHGGHGGNNDMHGANAEDVYVNLPVGTEVFDNDTGYMLADLKEVGQSVCVATGGRGGRGNSKKSEATPGWEGEIKDVRLELKLIADVGLVGFPNAGKSTLISRLSNAKSRIGAFPFTTKQPVLGVMSGLYDYPIVLADIPGLIEGAHEGKGMGDQFLRHIERTRLFVHMIDIVSPDGRDPFESYKIIKDELAAYSESFKSKTMILVANKIDLPGAGERMQELSEQVNEKVIGISAVTGEGVEELKKEIHRQITELRSQSAA